MGAQDEYIIVIGEGGSLLVNRINISFDSMRGVVVNMQKSRLLLARRLYVSDTESYSGSILIKYNLVPFHRTLKQTVVDKNSATMI